MSTFLRLVTTLLIATPLSAQVRLFMAPEGMEATVAITGPTTMYMEAGSTTRVIVWLEDLGSGQTLNFYNVLVKWHCVGLGSGTVQYLDDGNLSGGSVLVDEKRVDWVFADNETASTLYNESPDQGFGVSASRDHLSEADVVAGRNYIKEFDVTASADASGECLLEFVVHPPVGVGTIFGQADGLMPYLLDEFQDLRVVITHCGHGILEPNEPCDDGNLSSGDGCGDDCRIEPGWNCDGAPSRCHAAVPAVPVVSGWGMVVLTICLIGAIWMRIVGRATSRNVTKDSC
jgi:cysteine-rich repeat protein